ncbi:DUF4856 domain-containing protein [Flavobacteriaceae bacterium TP-CH-4]|uniref:DUF4856 domain-containing protein n=1 Tax=Pelagihabitans pacificus TaxID=2696054 RepID=A0A967AUK0_9FLAO|nr:DUF4856 domain-containing protein [Pelagihabitans pacificus]NHF57867.1 DUF4856 domain-containing protein [Pelagihabitans pacificus]
MNRLRPLLLLTFLVSLASCSSDDNDPVNPVATCSDNIQNGDETAVDCGGSCTPCTTGIQNPTSYTFERNGESTVDFSGQTTRLLMSEEILDLLLEPTTTSDALLAMYAHEQGVDNFENTELNASDKNIKSKTAASVDYFSSNSAIQAVVRADFDAWLMAQVNEVFPNFNVVASPGNPGQLPDGSSTRYVNDKGLEYDQLFNKGLIGAWTTDQVLNNYLSLAVLDEGNNRDENDADTVAEGKSYTTMEHKWDEAYGYVYGLNADAANPNADLGADSFLNKYIGRVEGDTDFEGIAETLFQAFKLGRAAIVAKNYEVRDAQIAIIKQKISEIIAIRAVYYLQQAKNSLTQETPAYGTAFHDLSEGYGFIYSLQFTRRPDAETPYFSKEEVDAFLSDLMNDGDNGLWDVTPETLDALSVAISDRFQFTLEEAAE